jgi:hypothetical protein
MPQASAADVKFPLSQSQKMAVRRNIERMIAEAVGPENVGVFLNDLTVGRWDQLPPPSPNM